MKDIDPLLRARISEAKQEIAIVPGLTDDQIRILAEHNGIVSLIVENEGDVSKVLSDRNIKISESDEYQTAFRTYLYNLGIS